MHAYRHTHRHAQKRQKEKRKNKSVEKYLLCVSKVRELLCFLKYTIRKVSRCLCVHIYVPTPDYTESDGGCVCMCAQDLKANEARLQELNNIADRLTAMGHTEAAEKIREQITVSLSRWLSSFVELAESVIPFGIVFPCGKLFSLFFAVVAPWLSTEDHNTNMACSQSHSLKAGSAFVNGHMHMQGVRQTVPVSCGWHCHMFMQCLAKL